MIDFYVDLFLVYLLFRFTKPRPKQDEKLATTSAMDYAHDHTAASVLIQSTMESMTEKRKSILLSKQHADFINYVIAQWSEELKSSVGISNEFLDKGSLIGSDY